MKNLLHMFSVAPIQNLARQNVPEYLLACHILNLKNLPFHHPCFDPVIFYKVIPRHIRLNEATMLWFPLFWTKGNK